MFSIKSVFRIVPVFLFVLSMFLLPPFDGAAHAATGPVIDITTRGAAGDGVHDDWSAIQKVLSTAPQNSTIVLPAGKVFRHSKVLEVNIRGTVLTGGGTLLASNEGTSEVLLNNNYTSIDHLTLKVSQTTRRWDAYEQMKLRIGPFTGIKVNDVTINGSAAAGIYVGGATNFTISKVTVNNTRADAIHMTSASSFGTISSVAIKNPGDDGVAVVSYRNNGVPCHDITINDARVIDQKWGRGFSVVGGRNIRWTALYADSTSAAGIYLASESNFNTLPTTNVTVDGAVLIRSNQTASVDHGAVLLYNGQAGTVNSDLTLRNVRIVDTRITASRQVAIINGTGAKHQRVALVNFTIVRGPRTVFWTNVPSSAYIRTNWSVVR